MTTPAQADDIQGNDGNPVALYTPTDGLSGQTANGKTTTTLAASSGDANVNSFVFFYSLDGVVGNGDDVQIADVANVNGWGTAQWTLPPNPTLGDIDLVYVEAQDNGNNVVSTAQSGGIVNPGNASDHNAVNIEGNYLEPLGVWDGRATLTGVSSDNDPLDISFDIAGPVTDEADSNPIVAGPTTAAGTPFAANVAVGANDTGDAYDEVVGRMSDAGESQDAQVYTLYNQAITNVDVAYDPAFPPNVNGFPANQNTQWVLTVTDQNGKPVTGVDIYESNAAGQNLGPAAGMGRTPDNSAAFDDDETDELGRVRVRLNEDGPVYGIDGTEDQNNAGGIGSTYVVVDKDQDGVFDNGSDQIVELMISELPQTPASIEITSDLGTVMDADEEPTFTITVKDANGDPIQDATTNVKIARDVLDDDPADFVEDLGNTDTGPTGTFTAQSAQDIGVDNNAATVTVTATSGPATGELVIETDEADVVWDNAPTSQALATTDTTEFATLQLPSGSVLPNRHVDIDLFRTLDADDSDGDGDGTDDDDGDGASDNGNASFAPQAEQPAGTIRGGDLIADATTDAEGRFGVKIDDPALPNGEELNDIVSGDTAFTGTSDLDLDWLRSLTPAEISIYQGPAGNDDSDGLPAGLGGYFGPLVPGSVGVGHVEVRNSDGVPLHHVDVDLTVDEGHFIDPLGDVIEANPQPGDPVDFVDDGQSITVNTSAGNGGFFVNIERHEGFDDDGEVDDKVRASVASLGDTHDFTWTTNATPLNPRATDPLVVELSADQESSVLPQARAGDTAGVGQVVNYDVMAFDQFGNPVSQDTDITDNTPLAGFITPGPFGDDTSYSLFQPVIVASATSATDQVLEVELDDAVKTTYADNVLDSSFDPFAAPSIAVVPVDIEQLTDPINWYDVDYGASTFTLGQEGPETVPVGTAVTEVVRAVDQEGQPLENMIVDFLRGGPSSEDDDTCNEDLLNSCQATDGNGEAFYDFVGGSAGTANVSAVLYSPEGVRITTVGPDTVVFSGENQPKAINARLRGSSSAGKDILRVNAPSVAAGAKVVLQKKVGNKWVKVGKTKRLDGSGDRQFGAKDRNGNKVTKYRAKVRATANNLADTTPVLRLR